MELSPSTKKQEYTDEIKLIEATLNDVSSGEAPKELFTYAQSKLDKLAARFQHDESLGAIRYKLYELQAVLYFYEHKDEEALAFIREAVQTKGGTYKRAEELKAQIEASGPGVERPAQVEDPASANRQGRLIGLGGWLAVFIAMVGIGAVINIVSLSEYPSAFTDLHELRAEYPDFVAALNPLLQYETLFHVALIITAAAIIVLLTQHRAIAKPIAIGFMAASLLLGLIDYMWAESIFRSFNLDVGNELDDAMRNIVRAMFSGSVWIPYLLVSKRVKATLTR